MTEVWVQPVAGYREKVELVEPVADRLEQLQGLVGGYIEIVPIVSAPVNDLVLVVDEEAHFKKDKTKNYAASRAAGFPIFGTAVYMRREDLE
jgi:hypothetical protein